MAAAAAVAAQDDMHFIQMIKPFLFCGFQLFGDRAGDVLSDQSRVGERKFASETSLALSKTEESPRKRLK